MPFFFYAAQYHRPDGSGTAHAHGITEITNIDLAAIRESIAAGMRENGNPEATQDKVVLVAFNRVD